MGISGSIDRLVVLRRFPCDLPPRVVLEVLARFVPHVLLGPGVPSSYSSPLPAGEKVSSTILRVLPALRVETIGADNVVVVSKG